MDDREKLLRIMLAWCNEVNIAIAVFGDNPNFSDRGTGAIHDDMKSIFYHLSEISGSTDKLHQELIYRISDCVAVESVASASVPRAALLGSDDQAIKAPDEEGESKNSKYSLIGELTEFRDWAQSVQQQSMVLLQRFPLNTGISSQALTITKASEKLHKTLLFQEATASIYNIDKEFIRQQVYERIRELSRMGYDDITGAIYDKGLGQNYHISYTVMKLLQQDWPEIVKAALAP